jgi:hypothetical protein
MNAEERETLSLGLAHGQSLRTMARVLGRAPSTLSREYARNAMRTAYRACTAQTLAAARANSWIPGCGSTCGRSWPRAARPSRLPDASDARILTT